MERTRAAKEVDKLLSELLPPAQQAVTALVVDALGKVAGEIARAIEGAEDHGQAFARLTDADIARQLYCCAAALSSAQRGLELRRAAGEE